MVACAVPLAVAIHSVGGHHRDLIAVFGPVIGGAFIGTGLFAWLRRPENRFGALMVALGFGYCLSGLIVSTDSWPFIAGLALIALPYAILFHILLAFPSGRLATRGVRALALAAYVTATARLVGLPGRRGHGRGSGCRPTRCWSPTSPACSRRSPASGSASWSC